jgi:hypothetical protein
MRILYLGNSYTFFNNLPAAIAALAGPEGAAWDAGLYLRGGAGLRTHFCDNFGFGSGRGRYCPDLDPARVGQLDTLLGTGPWDAVILQGQSMDTVLTPDDFFAYGKVLADRIRAAGSERILLYQTWARQHFPEMQPVITAGYAKLAAAIGAEVFQVGEAWKRALAERPDMLLHTEDRSHPNDKGSYLAACVGYQQLTGRSAVGCPLCLPDVRWERSDGLCYALDADTAAFLQRIAESIRARS